MAVFKLPLILMVSWLMLTVMATHDVGKIRNGNRESSEQHDLSPPLVSPSETAPESSPCTQIFIRKIKPTKNILESTMQDDFSPSFASNTPSQLSPLAPLFETPLKCSPNPQLYNHNIRPGENIVARLEGEGGGGGSGTMTECWNALMELKACTNEIILFFINGESYMGMDCCRAIRVITHQCWPSMLTSLGYTAEEGDVLKDYCGKSSPQPAPTGLLG